MVADTIRRFLREKGVGSCRLVAAVSGGFDSTALLLALAELRADGFEIVAGHVNHHLRGDESDGDEQFVRGLCASLGVPLVVTDGSLRQELVRAHGVEAAAREVRTRCLESIRQEYGARFIATAHQKNDQAETVLMRLFTGSGLAGLRGVHAVRSDGWIRPLLDVTRAEIEDFLRARNVTPRVDRMNDDPRYLRTRIRRTLSEYEPFVIDNLACVARQAQELWPEVEREIDEIEDAVVTSDATAFRSLPDDPALRAALLHRHIRRLDAHARDVSSDDLTRLANEIDEAKRISVTKELEIVKCDGAIILRRRRGKTEPFEVAITAPGRVTLPQLVIGRGIQCRMANVEFRIENGPEAILHSAFAIRHSPLNPRQDFTLPPGYSPHFTIRNRRPGDRFQPLGQTHAKKLKDFLIDRRIPREERDRIPLLVWNGEIVWVAGVEVSERFKVTDSAGSVYSATLHYPSP